jgi:repressor of nif and glnA expression
MGFETQDIERKIISILKILSESHEAMGARVIARLLNEQGIELGERAVRYHLKLMDGRGFTQLIGRDGRVITEFGIEELKSALVRDKVGFAISRIELQAFQTTFDLKKHIGLIPMNISLFPVDRFSKALKAMQPVYKAGFCVSDLVLTASEGEMLGELIVPEGKVALATVCSVVFNGTLLKTGVPMDSKFSGILQIKNNMPHRFIELIQYSGCSLDPSEVFIRARMTSVKDVVNSGNGRIVATYREIPAPCQTLTREVMADLKKVGIGGLLLMGNISETVCEIPVELNRIGIILINGLNPIAAAVEAGIEVENHGMSTVLEYQNLIKFEEL